MARTATKEQERQNARIEAIVLAMVEAGADACETPGREGVIELTLGAISAATKVAIAYAGSIEGARELIGRCVDDYLRQASTDGVTEAVLRRFRN